MTKLFGSELITQTTSPATPSKIMDFSEAGLISLLTNFVLIFLIIMVFKEGKALYKVFKKEKTFLNDKKKLIGFIVFTALFALTLTAGSLTSLIATDFISGILSGFFFLTLMLGLRFKKTISIFWITLILCGIALFLSLFAHLVNGEEGQILASVTFVVEKDNQAQMNLNYKGKLTTIPVYGSMAGFEAYQVVLKPYMGFLFGKKRLLLTSVFSEKFNEDFSKGETFYTPLENSFLDKKSLWESLRKKALLLPGMQGVQRVMVSVYPEIGKLYQLKITNQGLILVKP